MLRNILARLDMARAALFDRVNLVVIYDVRQPNGGDSEEYYGYFASRQEAIDLFTEAFGLDKRVHNAYICLVVDHLFSHYAAED